MGSAGSRARILEHPCSDNPLVTCNQLTIFHTEAGDTGYFTCSYKDVADIKDPNGKTSVYVYVKGEWVPPALGLKGFAFFRGCLDA